MSSRYLVEFLRHSDFGLQIAEIMNDKEFDDYTFRLLKIKVRELVQDAYSRFIEQSNTMDSNEYVMRYKYFLLLNSSSMSDSVCREAIQAVYGDVLC